MKDEVSNFELISAIKNDEIKYEKKYFVLSIYWGKNKVEKGKFL